MSWVAGVGSLGAPHETLTASEKWILARFDAGTAPLMFAGPSAGAAQPVVEAYEECDALYSQQLSLAAELTPVAHVADVVQFCAASADGPVVEGSVVGSVAAQLKGLSDRSARLRSQMDALGARLFAVQADGSASEHDAQVLEDQLGHLRQLAAQTQVRLQALQQGRAATWLWLPSRCSRPWYTPRARLPAPESLSFVRALLAHGAARGIGARALLEVAAWPASAPPVAALLSAAAGAAAGQAHGVSATHAAAAAGNVSLLRELAARGGLALGARVRRPRRTGLSPVSPHGPLCLKMVASALAGARCQAGRPLARFAEARTRRERRVDPDLTGLTPLQLAALCGEAEAAAFLLQAGADPLDTVQPEHPPNAGQQFYAEALVGGTAVHAAALSGAVDCFRLCLSAARATSLASVLPVPFDLGSRTVAGRTLTHLAVLSGSPEMVAAVATEGCPLDSPAAHLPLGMALTPLSEAILLHDEALVAALLAAGARPEATEVLLAVEKLVPEPVLRQLAAGGVPLDGVVGGLTALHRALGLGHNVATSHVVPLLLELGADPNALGTVDGVPCTALQQACIAFSSDMDHAAVIPVLLERGAKPLLRVGGMAALHYAAHAVCLPALRVLLDQTGLRAVDDGTSPDGNLEADLGGSIDAELGLHAPHPAFDPRNLLDLCLKGYLRHLDYVRSSAARQALAVNAAQCLEAMRAHGAPPPSAPALAAVRAAAGGGEGRRLAEQVCMAAAAPAWSPAAHRRWPEAFQAAARGLLLALNAASRGRGGSAVPRLGPHEQEEVLRRAAYPIADWMELTARQQAAARGARPRVYRAAADDDELPTAAHWWSDFGSDDYSSEAEEWPGNDGGCSNVSRDGGYSDVGEEWPSSDYGAGSDSGSEDA